MLLFVLSDLANGMPLSISGYFINFIFEDNKYLGNPERCSDKEFTRMLTCTFNEGPVVGKAGTQLAGRLNMTNVGKAGTQLAGRLNMTNVGKAGTQLAGRLNMTNVGKAGTQLAGRLNMTNGFRYWVNPIPELTLNSKSGIDCQESIRIGIAVSGGAVVLLRLHAAPCKK